MGLSSAPVHDEPPAPLVTNGVREVAADADYGVLHGETADAERGRRPSERSGAARLSRPFFQGPHAPNKLTAGGVPKVHPNPVAILPDG